MRIVFSDPAAPAAPDFGDVYHARQGALVQARHVFLAGNGLLAPGCDGQAPPGRWAGRPRFTVLETGFGLGHNFLATWAAWRADAQRPRELLFVSLDKHPPRRDDLARALAQHQADAEIAPLAQALLAHWPPLTPDLHLIDLPALPDPTAARGAAAASLGRVRLLLALGDIAQVLPELVLQADAIYLDGFAPSRNPAMWDPRQLQRLARLAAPGATLATWSVASTVREALAAAGFQMRKLPGLPGKREMSVGQFMPRVHPPPPPGRPHLAARPPRRVAVIGAGLAGAAVARALAAQGCAVQVIERRDAPAMETSGNAGGLFHGIVHAQDGPHARWLRAGALHMQRVLAPLLAAGRVSGAADGLLRSAHDSTPAAMQALIERLGLPADYLQIDAHAWPAASSLAGAAWRYPGAGWAAPAELVRAWLDDAAITLRCGVAVHRLQRLHGAWQLLDADDQPITDADAVVLANAGEALRLLDARCTARWLTGRQRGQTTLLPAALPGLPALPVPLAAGGYALRLPDGRLLCGATSQPGDDDPAVRTADHAHNLAALQRVSGWAAPLDPQQPGDAAQLQGRTGWRFVTDDRLPLLGPVPVAEPTGHRLEQPRQVPREPGLWIFSALGSRGLSQAALGGELLAAWMCGAPLPAPAALLDAVDPARFFAREQRHRQDR
ncbi:FAD-dependent 5-carboxymethylaminomethyl-2-thiouridine(34) oxidoreductase MnmC [Aquabacterium sp. OR-4]|uniref:FAD-dependent 5-carboxymethylaminomethyl-2-thiouridine(34) oxidoreductase MnmC n=1 Tax=Aquabacterium sp. OR-4 TaxID=2978127 RepID=UPI0028C7F874|nr:FAD-dependent 5-carboxymethylaminomethyl-2-thiouridine(34) oxidoreductase MnmC [Aquabacterium sp. OR-4]MDT7836721.1 FAD-dependent 5-carboxymethylaminomethyl-2-thiouridine(34) oxidoreductase MnmC [Aquabacterium sp. OR-4]